MLVSSSSTLALIDLTIHNNINVPFTSRPVLFLSGLFIYFCSQNVGYICLIGPINAIYIHVLCFSFLFIPYLYFNFPLPILSIYLFIRHGILFEYVNAFLYLTKYICLSFHNRMYKHNTIVWLLISFPACRSCAIWCLILHKVFHFLF